MKNIFWFILLVLSSESNAEKILFADNFSYPPTSKGILPSDYWYEGSKAVWIDTSGHLRTDANPDNSGEDYNVSTVWLSKKFSGDLKVEFDAHVLVSNGDANNINFLFLFSDSKGDSLYNTRVDRVDGAYKKYHSSTLNGYIFTFLANGNPVARFRLRDCPGFNLLQEKFGYEVRQGKTYHVTITKKGNRITQAVDGTVYIDSIDNRYNMPYSKGLIGFRTWSTDLWWDNLKVIQLSDGSEK